MLMFVINFKIVKQQYTYKSASHFFQEKISQFSLKYGICKQDKIKAAPYKLGI